MTNEYLNLFSALIKKRSLIINNRNLLRSPPILVMNFIFVLMKLKNIIKYFVRIIIKKF